MNYVFTAAFGECKVFVHSLAHSLPLETALFVYDTLLTLPQEVHHTWNKKFKLGTTLYILARYSTLLYLSLLITGRFMNFTSLEVWIFIAFTGVGTNTWRMQ
jgi:Family of unknown function (DUF6533)